MNRVVEALEPLYGPIDRSPRLPPLEELIFTVLTQHTSDRNAEKAFARLQETFEDWETVEQASEGEIAYVIRSGGLANQKAKHLKDILRRIKLSRGSMSLEWLRDMPMEKAREKLQQLPGVGIKTASVVLAFSFGMPCMPVDTHIHRVSRRLGLIPESVSAEKAHGLLESLVPENMRFNLHVLLITHGRRVCKARRPNCTHCPLRTECPASTFSSI